jgi:hypothetical protein
MDALSRGSLEERVRAGGPLLSRPVFVENFMGILRAIFGIGESAPASAPDPAGDSWFALSEKDAAAAAALCAFLRPSGALFRAMAPFVDDPGARFGFPVALLPDGVRRALDAGAPHAAPWTPAAGAAPFAARLRAARVEPDLLELGAVETYLLCFALFPRLRRRGLGAPSVAYLQLVNEYTRFFLVSLPAEKVQPVAARAWASAAARAAVARLHQTPRLPGLPVGWTGFLSWPWRRAEAAYAGSRHAAAASAAASAASGQRSDAELAAAVDASYADLPVHLVQLLMERQVPRFLLLGCVAMWLGVADAPPPPAAHTLRLLPPPLEALVALDGLIQLLAGDFVFHLTRRALVDARAEHRAVRMLPSHDLYALQLPLYSFFREAVSRWPSRAPYPLDAVLDLWMNYCRPWHETVFLRHLAPDAACGAAFPRFNVQADRVSLAVDPALPLTPSLSALYGLNLLPECEFFVASNMLLFSAVPADLLRSGRAVDGSLGISTLERVFRLMVVPFVRQISLRGLGAMSSGMRPGQRGAAAGAGINLGDVVMHNVRQLVGSPEFAHPLRDAEVVLAARDAAVHLMTARPPSPDDAAFCIDFLVEFFQLNVEDLRAEAAERLARLDAAPSATRGSLRSERLRMDFSRFASSAPAPVASYEIASLVRLSYRAARAFERVTGRAVPPPRFLASVHFWVLLVLVLGMLSFLILSVALFLKLLMKTS